MGYRNRPQMWIMKITEGNPHESDSIKKDPDRLFDQLFKGENPPNVIGYSEGDSSLEGTFLGYFKDDMAIGDLVVVMAGLNRVLGVVLVESEYYYESNTSEVIWFTNRRRATLIKKFEQPFDVTNRTSQHRIIKVKPGIESEKIANEVWNLIESKYFNMSINKKMNDYSNLLENTPQLILEGPPGTGKTREAKRIANWLVSNGSETGQAGDNSKVDTLQWATDNGQIQFTQFHPAYNYDDFIRGLVPQKGKDGSISFEPQDKVLLQIAKKARQYPETTYVLIIDEINRANLPEVMGELIYALEYRGEPFNVVYPESFESDNYQEYIPGNLYIIGTMNTADRSVGTLDYAIKRRFVFERLLPDRNVITSEKAENLFKKVEKLFDQENEGYNCRLSPEFDKDDVMLGHSYFLAEDDDQLSINLEYKIKPILREYVKDGVLIDNQNGEEALSLIKKLQL